jgi:hypothetical protein
VKFGAALDFTELHDISIDQVTHVRRQEFLAPPRLPVDCLGVAASDGRIR